MSCCSASAAAAALLLSRAGASRLLLSLLCCGGACFDGLGCGFCFGWSDQPVRRLLNSSAPHALKFASGLPLPSGRD